MAKVSELWAEVEKTQAEHTAAGLKMAVLDAHKILEIVLESKGYPGKIERKLNLAGYSLSEKDPIRKAIDKQKEILKSFEYQISDFEAKEIVADYKKVIDEVMARGKFSGPDKIKAFFNYYFSPKSMVFWRNLGIVVGILVLIRLAAETEAGKSTVALIVNLADFIISFQFLAILVLVLLLIFGINYYLSNKTKVKIKEED